MVGKKGIFGARNLPSEEVPGKAAANHSAVQSGPMKNIDTAVHHYRPEIDGLRALAVIAVLINHLNPSWLPGGYLGVDLFFVISGYVVTGSLLGKRAEGAKNFLLNFYRRRFRRLMPALVVNIVLVAIFFVALVHPQDGVTMPALRSGMAALVGVSNLYFLRQGNNYFATDNHFNPFLHTWSLGVEEQFYLLWPLVLLLCGLGRPSPAGIRARLSGFSLALGAASLLLLWGMQLRGSEAASFFLMPPRFWELAAGALVLLWRPSAQGHAAGLRHHSWLQAMLLLALAAVFLISEAWRLPATFACVLISAALLWLLSDRSGPGKWLCKPLPLAIGLSSYSLYLWHWPVIVLAKWTVGLNRFTLLPIIGLIALFSWFSFLVESRFRRPRSRTGMVEALTLYPLLSFAAMGFLGLLQGPARGMLFVGDRRNLNLDLTNSRYIPGTDINTVNCFRDPLSPLSEPFLDKKCLEKRFPSKPTLFFEGDSHTEMLIPLGESLLKNGVNVSFFARGGCPAPSFEPRANGTHTLPRYRFCKADTDARLQRRLRVMAPGDWLVLAISLPNYLVETDGQISAPALAAHRQSIRDLASSLQARGAGLILLSPLPAFPQRSALSLPVSLCLREWYRPARHPRESLYAVPG